MEFPWNPRGKEEASWVGEHAVPARRLVLGSTDLAITAQALIATSAITNTEIAQTIAIANAMTTPTQKTSRKKKLMGDFLVNCILLFALWYSGVLVGEKHGNRK